MLPLDQLLVPSRELVGEVSAEIKTRSRRLRLQPLPPTVAAPAAHGCSPCHLRLQASVEIKCVSLRAGRASLQWGVRRPYVLYLLSDLLIICQRHRFQSGTAFKVSLSVRRGCK